MSIPPLVCSTPPPPEQCEDDKDAEDFDLQYNLSQYDDDDSINYNYGDFSSYDHYKSTLSEKKESSSSGNIVENDTSNVNILMESKFKVECEAESSTANKLSSEEDINIEDLDLKLEQELVENSTRNYLKEEEIKRDSIESHSSGKDELSDIPNSINHDSISNKSLPKTSDILQESTEYLDHVEEKETFDEIIEDKVEENENENSQNMQVNSNILPETSKEELHISSNVKNEDILNDDFDDFQFISSDKVIDNIPAFVDTCDNPWENDQVENSDFGDFTANFEDNNSNELNTALPNSEFDTNDNLDITNEMQTKVVLGDNDEDDFGDFDDFRSTTMESRETELSQEPELLSQQVPVFNLQSSDNEVQIMESINKVLNSIFKEDVAETEEKFEGTLDSLLSVTWGHLMETDVRQPYMVNWNKSLAQKTLLKALCIDSRNILFGPKRSYNMPKYAANLSAAPLQPQKQATPSNTQQSEVASTDKATNKSGTWTDPFTSNGQESCNSNNSDKTVIEPTPTDLDVFEAAMSSKSDKIYSSTLSVQPIRQINLPDTHIFTPSDSEIPRSKTIHYDCGPVPTVLIPQAGVESVKSEEEKSSHSLDTVIYNNTETDEYWEFQDFKGPANDVKISQSTVSLPQNQPQISEETSNTLPKSNVVYETQLLQPIKLDLIMPTLNWPDPGEVKETFDDFSDFISSSSTSNDKQELQETGVVDNNTSNVALEDKDVTITKRKEDISTANNTYDDEFDTFQSALPSNKNADFDFNFSALDSKTSSNTQNENVSSQPKMTDFDVHFPTTDNLKSDNISFTNDANDTLPPSIDITVSKVPNIKTGTGLIKKSPGLQMDNTNVLQPTPSAYIGQMQSTSSGFTQTHQKSGQILQPLSLESYSQINWPNPGIDLQDLSRFNPLESLQSLKGDNNTSGHSKMASPVHNQKNIVINQASDEDIWGEFVSSIPKQQQQPLPKKSTFGDDDEWTDFVSSPSVKPQNGLNTISFNVHTNSNMQKSANQNKYAMKNNQIPMDIPTLNYITPKTNNHKSYNDRHFQNL
ncbi:LOW QUALITY PROTEIN: aftiphilin [Aphomia sociella]